MIFAVVTECVRFILPALPLRVLKVLALTFIECKYDIRGKSKPSSKVSVEEWGS